MHSFPRLPALVLLAGAFICSLLPSAVLARDTKGASIDYSVAVPDTKTETFDVSATLHNISGDTLTFYFPIWTPGAYDIVNYGAFVHDFVATDRNGKQLKVVRSDTNTFRIIGAKGKELRLTYRVKDIESLPNSLWFGLSDIEGEYAFAVGAALFGYPAGYKDIPYTVSYAVPPDWEIAIGLDRLPDTRNAYRADDYDELVDAPLQMGKFQRFEFTEQGKPHIITITAPDPLDDSTAKAFVDMTRKIIGIQSSFFGDMPYDRYVFQHYLVPLSPGDFSFGALEHANSSTYRMPLMPDGDVVAQMAPIVSHEYWHLWSPKRFHVAQLGPFDYQSAPRTKSLWFHEGLTEYYARVLMVRNGMSGPQDYIDELNNVITPSYGNPQRRSITELSMNISEADLGETTALYSKGPLLGLLLDAEIRSQTNNRTSLDDAMRHFNDTYGKTGRTFSDGDIIPIMEKVTGAKLQDFYDNYIDGGQTLPYDRLLPKIGLSMAVEQEKKVTLGAEVESAEDGWSIGEVEPGGTADSTGLRTGDVVSAITIGKGPQAIMVSLVEYPASVADQVMEQVPTFLPGTLTVKRDGKELTLPVTYVSSSVDIHLARIDTNPSPEAAVIRRSMFGF